MSELARLLYHAWFQKTHTHISGLTVLALLKNTTRDKKLQMKGDITNDSKSQCLKISTTPLRQCGFWQCLPFSWTTLIGKHCRHPIAVMGVVDTFEQCSHMWVHWLLSDSLVFTSILWSMYSHVTHKSQCTYSHVSTMTWKLCHHLQFTWQIVLQFCYYKSFQWWILHSPLTLMNSRPISVSANKIT
jgi:hypothetical protein